MRSVPRRSTAAVGGILVGVVVATSAPRLPAQSTVLAATGPSIVRGAEPWQNAVTAMPDGSMWCLATENDGSGLASGQRLWLCRSLDSGATWTPVVDTPTDGDARGALATGIDCDTLHVAWSANPSGVAYDLYHQAFDVATATWVGTPTQLLQGTNSNDQYYACDIDVTGRGTVGITFHTHRTPLTTGLTAWSGGLFVRRVADTQWQGPYRLNTDSYGMNASLQAVGETFHASFRTNSGLYGIRYRGFDAATLQFTTASDVPLYGASQSTMLATNTSCIRADRDGNLYVLFNVGAPTAPGSGEIRIAYAQAGNYGTWTHSLVAQDGDLTAGNVTYHHFSLAGEGSQVFAIYARRTTEQFQNLYMRIYSGGVALTPEVPIASGQVDQFAYVSGLRGSGVHAGPMAVTAGTPASASQGLVQFVSLGATARTVRFGTSCSGSLPTMPRLRSASLPQLGASFAAGFDGLPATTFGLLFAGGTCQRPPIALDFAGMPGCRVFHDNLAAIGFFSDPQGSATVAINVPANPVLTNTLLHFGGFVLAPGANAAGALTTNALSTLFR